MSGYIASYHYEHDRRSYADQDPLHSHKDVDCSKCCSVVNYVNSEGLQTRPYIISGGGGSAMGMSDAEFFIEDEISQKSIERTRRVGRYSDIETLSPQPIPQSAPAPEHAQEDFRCTML